MSPAQLYGTQRVEREKFRALAGVVLGRIRYREIQLGDGYSSVEPGSNPLQHIQEMI